VKFSLLVGTSQINSIPGKCFGTGSTSGLRHLGELMEKVGIKGDLIDLPNQSRSAQMASPFSIESGFSLNPDELDWSLIPELTSINPVFSALSVLRKNFEAGFSDQRSLSYQLKRTLTPWVLDGCFQVFCSKNNTNRLAQYQAFESQASGWLNEFALYKAAKIRGLGAGILTKMDIPVVREAFLLRESEEINRQKYIQFLCFEQRISLINDLRGRGIRLFVNLPFGVDAFSPDVIFHPEAFDTSLQVGCSPEPENGYPEQAWGMPVYREKAGGLVEYLSKRLEWLGQISDGVFIDHLVGWSGQYVLPVDAPANTDEAQGWFLTEDRDERARNIDWYLDLVLSKGLSILAEVAGDAARLLATESGVRRQIEKGEDIKLMSLPRWQRKERQLVPLSEVSKETLLMSETHDTSTLLQYLLNRKGRFEDFESPASLLEFCHTILGLPLQLSQLPLTLENLSDEVCFELLARLVNGSAADQFVMTLPSLLSWVDVDYRSSSWTNNINVAPGTGGEVGNEQGNWAFYSPPIERLETPKIAEVLGRIGGRSYLPFDGFHRMDTGPHISAIYSSIGNRKIIEVSKSEFVVSKSPLADQPDLVEFLITNLSQEVAQGMLTGFGWLKNLDRPGSHVFCDLNQGSVQYSHLNQVLQAEGLFYQLEPGQTHHFLVWYQAEASH